MNTNTTATATATNEATATAMTVNSHVAADFIATIEAGFKGLKAGTVKELESSEGYKLLKNASSVLATVDDTQAQLVTGMIENEGSMNSTVFSLRNTYIDSVVSNELALIKDEKVIAAGESALIEHTKLFNIIAVFEKEHYVRQLASEKGMTVAEFYAKADPKEIKKALSKTNGCDIINRYRAGFSKLVKTRLQKALDNDRISEEFFNEHLISYQVNKESGLWEPRQATTKPAPTGNGGENGEDEAAAAAAKSEDQINSVVRGFENLTPEQQAIAAQKIINIGGMVDIFEIAIKAYNEAQAILAAKIENGGSAEETDEETVIAAFRVQRNKVASLDKQPRKPTAKARKAEEDKLKALVTELTERGIDTTKIQ